MEIKKSELAQKIQSKGLTFREVGEKIEINPEILSLYFNDDDYPVSVRIMKKISELVAA